MIGDDYDNIVEDEIMKKISDSNPEEANSKRIPKKKKRCIVVLCFFLVFIIAIERGSRADGHEF